MAYILIDVGNEPRPKTTHLGGGLDTDTPPRLVHPGRCADAVNYEIHPDSGYQDLQGYERFSGQLAPSSAFYAVVFFGSERAVDWNRLTRRINLQPVRFVKAGEETVYGSIMADLFDIDAIVLSTHITEDGRSMCIPDGATLQVRNEADTAWVNADPVKNAHEVHNLDSNILKEHAQLVARAAGVLRARIDPIDGNGKTWVLGMLGNTLYAVRDSEDSSHAKLYKSTSSGWEEIPIGTEARTVLFTGGMKTGGSKDIPGIALTGLDQSGGTGIDLGAAVGDIEIETISGDWTDGTAAGVLRWQNATTAVVAESAVIAATNFAGTINLVDPYFVLAVGGRFEADKHDYGRGEKLYVVDGKNDLAEFDGEQWVPIPIEGGTYKPEHVLCQEDHVFVSSGNTVRHSGIGNPFDHTAIGGAAEFNLKSLVTAIHVEPGESGGSAVSIFTRKRITVLYGSSTNNWTAVPYREQVGALPYTVQEPAQTVFLDERGFRVLENVQAFGNFRHATLSGHTQRYINKLVADGVPVGSCIVGEKNQYRVYFDNGNGFHATFRGERMLGLMPINFPDAPSCLLSFEDGDGRERVFMGSETGGHVYELERGTSFDGENIRAYLRLHRDFMGARYLGYNKKFFSTVIEGQGHGYSEFMVSFNVRKQLDQSRPSGDFKVLSTTQPLFWDDFIWDNFVWDDAGIGPSRLKLGPKGNNIDFLILKDSDYMGPLNLYSFMTKFLPLRPSQR